MIEQSNNKKKTEEEVLKEMYTLIKTFVKAIHTIDQTSNEKKKL